MKVVQVVSRNRMHKVNNITNGVVVTVCGTHFKEDDPQLEFTERTAFPSPPKGCAPCQFGRPKPNRKAKGNV